MQTTVRVIEVFSSIQGEGVYVGQPHLFVRFWDCNMACRYCDTDYRGPYKDYSQEELHREVSDLEKQEGPHHAVSLTGGEPLLWWRFLKDWLPQLKELGPKVYLETNGTLPSALSELLPWIDIIAMDIKPPSATQDRPVWKNHEEFIRTAYESKKEIFVKIVASRGTADDEMQRACDLVKSVDSRIPVILQPVTPWGTVKEKPDSQQLQRWRLETAKELADVRIIPQVHRLLGVK